MILTTLLASLAFAFPQEPISQAPHDPAQQQFQEPEDSATTPTAKEIVVIATRLAESLFGIPRSVTVVDEQTLREKARLPELLGREDMVLVKNPGAEDMEMIIKTGERIEHLQPTGSSLVGEGGEKLGTAYRLPSGEVVYVPAEAPPDEE